MLTLFPVSVMADPSGPVTYSIVGKLTALWSMAITIIGDCLGFVKLRVVWRLRFLS
jgi:hypothetical protein